MKSDVGSRAEMLFRNNKLEEGIGSPFRVGSSGLNVEPEEPREAK